VGLVPPVLVLLDVGELEVLVVVDPEPLLLPVFVVLGEEEVLLVG
jgi:hypothetical protein